MRDDVDHAVGLGLAGVMSVRMKALEKLVEAAYSHMCAVARRYGRKAAGAKVDVHRVHKDHPQREVQAWVDAARGLLPGLPAQHGAVPPAAPPGVDRLAELERRVREFEVQAEEIDYEDSLGHRLVMNRAYMALMKAVGRRGDAN